MTSTPTQPASIALVDLSYLFKKRWHTIPLGERNAAAKATLHDLQRLRDGVEHVIICRDAPPYLRADVFPAYKANRPAMEPEERAQRKWLYEQIKLAGFNFAWSQGYEADDVIATLAHVYGQWCPDVRIVGPDKDLAQCVTGNVVQYVPPHGDRDWQVRDADGVREKFGVSPDQIPLWQALCGDDGDNIPGVRGIGPVKAAKLVNCHHTLAGLADAMAAASTMGAKASAEWRALADNWEALRLSLQLVTLDRNTPVDADALLVRHAPVATPPQRSDMDVEMDGFMPNATPGPDEQVFEQAKQVYEARFVEQANDRDPEEGETREAAPESARAAKDPDLLEQEYDRERQRQGESDPASNEPGRKGATPARPRPAKSTAIVRSDRYGMVTHDLQPLDLVSARTISEWIAASELYPQFKTATQIFAVLLRGKELGLGATTALAGHHVIDGRPVASADLLRALVERDPNFEYLMPVELSATRCVWEGKHKRHPRPVTYAYTIEEAVQAGLAKSGNYGKPGNWEKRPQDMLAKTASSKLARLLWPGATLGLYCPEELGYSEEELGMREAA